MMNLPDKKVGCHRTGFTKKCHKLVTSGVCDRWYNVQGVNPNTGEQVNKSACIDNWTPAMLLEIAQMERHTTASVDKVATETKKFHTSMMEANEVALLGMVRGGPPQERLVRQEELKQLSSDVYINHERTKNDDQDHSQHRVGPDPVRHATNGKPR